MSSTLKTLILWMVIFVVVILLWNSFQAGKVNQHELSFSEFLEEVDQRRIAEVTIRGQEVSGTFREGGQYAATEEFVTLSASRVSRPGRGPP